MPFLVVVNGPPGSGKTTLAPRIADELGAVCISREPIQEAIFDGWEPRHPALDPRLRSENGASFNAGRVSWEIFFWMVQQTAKCVPVVAESPFNHHFSRERFALLRRELKVPVVEVFLSAPADRLLKRVEDRASHPNAHPLKVHFTLEPARELLASPYEPLLHEAAHRVHVDTHDLTVVDVDAVTRDVRAIVATLGPPS